MSAAVLWAADPLSRPAAAGLPPAAPGTIDFERDIRPIFAAKCLSCHGAEKQRGGLRLDHGKAALEGGNSGVVIKPGDAAGSRLLRLVAGLDPDTRMPPAETRQSLSAEEVGKLRAWIEQGAVWPTSDEAVATQIPRSSHWAYQPIRRPTPPVVQHREWPVRNAIDQFILARLEQEGLTPSPEADRNTLVRRLSLDLIGLPPTPEEVDAACADPSADWYEKVVDRLLQSPHYGERWGRHWLDAARYADSDGYEKDLGRPNAWRWRNWVIDALNRDLPFDQFTIEQLAGDLLPNATLEQKIATGFHRNTLTNREGGVDQEQFRVEAVVDRVNTTFKVFLGQTFNCCQCHDHKYDPFSQREYYQVFAFFNSDVETDTPAATPDEQKIYDQQKAAFDRKRGELQRAIQDYKAQELPAKVEAWEKALTEAERKKLPADVTAALDVAPEQRTEQQRQLLINHLAKTDARLGELTKALTAHERTAPKLPVAPILTRGQPRKTHVMIRGDFLRPGIAVEPNTPAVLPPLRPSAASGSGPTRLDLARWIVSPDNPLTARVIVNWVWHKYFTRGIVPTLEDFGTQGEKPTHPELLDWLASEFMARGWSLKELHRLIVTSATYRQVSHARPELLQRDPYNALLARQSRPRLEAEILRDSALAVSGLLVRRIGGPSVRPPQPAGISELTYAGSAKWVESTGPDRYRRGLYTWFQRTSPYPMLMTFDAPDSNLCCVRRERSNTPLQALTLLNDTVFVECAQALGARLVREKATTAERLRHAFRLCLAREPLPAEMDILSRLYDGLRHSAAADPAAAAKLAGQVPPGVEPAEAAAWVGLARAVLNLDEFLTRE
ncbi:MAG: PSD1 and planctomycete cytochrome C domain-containing protein [Gemmataceae bacterium]|nr:PSD1 and planctomycete cytochrome C domain-containing protein [Gemmataceae bacterium]MDW8264012.1 PSD1 and planctomycete cytochrome C domain-containing protein [Gemmataceae bacterium]